MRIFFKIFFVFIVMAILGYGCSRKNSNVGSQVKADNDVVRVDTAPVSNVSMKVESKTTNNQEAIATEVNWMTFEEAVEKSKTEKRKIFIDVYTDWCGWCKVMDKNTFSESRVARLLNTKFYPVKFNAEQKEDVIFNGTTFKFVESGRSGYHELAVALLNKQLSYPTVVFLDEDFRMIQPLAGYRKAPEFHMIAQFIGEDHYKTVKFAEWQKTYKSPYSPEEKTNN
jgi:thioredoxin-related protein